MHRITIFSLIIACTTLSFFNSCRQKPGEIGDNLLHESNYLKASFRGDSSIVAYSVRWDSLNTGSQNHALIGSMVDSVFGSTKAGFYIQIIPSSSMTNFGDDIQIDSVIWEIVYGGYYGDTTTQQTIHVYQITDAAFNDSTTLWSGSSFNCGVTDYAQSATFYPHPKSKYIVGADTSNTPKLRIKLDNALAQRIMVDAAADSIALRSTDDFTSFFNGLYVTCDDVAAGGAISYLYLISSSSYITVYYRNSESVDSTMQYYYSTTAQQLRCNTFAHDYTLASTGFISQVTNHDTTLGAKRLYLQSMAGVRTRIRLLGFENWQDTTDKKIVVNEAKLVLPNLACDTDTYAPPTQLALVVLGNEEGTTTSNIPDLLMGTDYFGGTYENGKVTFRVTRYVQDLIQAGTNITDNYGLYILVVSASNNAERWIFKGPDVADGMHLDIIYSLVNVD